MSDKTKGELQYEQAKKRATKSVAQITDKAAKKSFVYPIKEYKHLFHSTKTKDKEWRNTLHGLCPNITDEYAMGYAYAVDEMLTYTYIALINTFTCTVNAAANNEYVPTYNWPEIYNKVKTMYHTDMDTATLLHNILLLILPEFRRMLNYTAELRDYEAYCAENVFVEEVLFDKYTSLIKKYYPASKLSSEQKKKIENEEIHRCFIPVLIRQMSYCFSTNKDEINIHLANILNLALNTGFCLFKQVYKGYTERYDDGAMLGYLDVYHPQRAYSQEMSKEIQLFEKQLCVEINKNHMEFLDSEYRDIPRLNCEF